MGKKRKAPGHSTQEPEGPNLDVGESRRSLTTYQDVADSDDEFHDSRDRVWLDEAPDAKRRRQWQERDAFLQPSDEEVLGYSEPEDEDGELEAGVVSSRPASDSDDGLGEDEEDEEEGESGWGTARTDLYGADAIETEEQALEEEAEALRLQQKQLQGMTAADYGFDEAEWQDGGGIAHEVDGGNAVVTEVLPQLQVPDSMGPAERLKLLKSRYPEFDPLSKELLELQGIHAALREEAERRAPKALVKHRAASAYLGALAMYFSLLTSTAWDGQSGVGATSAALLRDHPVMESLMECRNLWLRVRDLPADEIEMAPLTTSIEAALPSDLGTPGPSIIPIERKPKKSRAQIHAEAAKAASSVRKAERLKRTEAHLADLDALVAQASAKKVSKPKPIPTATSKLDDSDVGEEAPLTALEAAEKAKRKKSLRFYTSQITQKANRRGASGRTAGGDEDVPYRERLKDRQARLNAEAERRGKRPADADAELGGDSGEEDARQARQIRADADELDYYDIVAARAAKKKTDKTALAAAQKEAALQNGRVVEAETVGADGKRKISYLIEKNKGLTPHRKKDVRNPRVKKRKKYDDKKKKLASIKPIYKGGEGRGGYGGELTGIKKGLVKSTKLWV